MRGKCIFIAGLLLLLLTATSHAAQMDATKDTFRMLVTGLAAKMEAKDYANLPLAKPNGNRVELVIDRFTRLSFEDTPSQKKITLLVGMPSDRVEKAKQLYLVGTAIALHIADPDLPKEDVAAVTSAIFGEQGKILRNGILYRGGLTQTTTGMLLSFVAEQKSVDAASDTPRIPANEFRQRLIDAAKRLKVANFSELPKASIGEKGATIKIQSWLFSLSPLDKSGRGDTVSCMVMYDSDTVRAVQKRLADVFQVLMLVMEPSISKKERADILKKCGFYKDGGSTERNGLRYDVSLKKIMGADAVTVSIGPAQ